MLSTWRGKAADVTHDELPENRGRIHWMLEQMSPGCSTSLQVVSLPDGTAITDPGGIATALREHWGDVFRKRPRAER